MVPNFGKKQMLRRRSPPLSRRAHGSEGLRTKGGVPVGGGKLRGHPQREGAGSRGKGVLLCHHRRWGHRLGLLLRHAQVQRPIREAKHRLPQE